MIIDHWRYKDGDNIPIPDPPPELLTPPLQLPEIIEVPNEPRVPVKYSFPDGFDIGPNRRVRRLNQLLLRAYGVVGIKVNEHYYQTRKLEANLATCGESHLHFLTRKIKASEKQLNDAVQLALYYIHEIDAIGGQAYVHIPPALADTVILHRAVVEKSLQHLAEANYYFEEIDYPLPPGVLIVGNMVDNYVAHGNRMLRGYYQEIAASYNRMNFLISCGEELRERNYYAELYDKLLKDYDIAFDKLRDVVQYRVAFGEKPHYGETFSFPANLKEAVDVMLSILPTSAKWIQEKEGRRIQEQEAKEREEERRRIQEQEAKEREERLRIEELERIKELEEARRWRDEAKRQREEYKRRVEVRKQQIAINSKKKQKVGKPEYSNPFAILSSDVESSSEDEAPVDKDRFLAVLTRASKKRKEVIDREKQKHIADRKARTLFLGNLPWSAEIADVKIFFKGQAVDVKIPRQDDGRNKGFCFVEFDSAAAASKALEENQSKFILGRRIHLQMARNGPTPQSGMHGQGIRNIQPEAGGTSGGRSGGHADGPSRRAQGTSNFGGRRGGGGGGGRHGTSGGRSGADAGGPSGSVQGSSNFGGRRGGGGGGRHGTSGGRSGADAGGPSGSAQGSSNFGGRRGGGGGGRH